MTKLVFIKTKFFILDWHPVRAEWPTTDSDFKDYQKIKFSYGFLLGYLPIFW